MRTVHDVGDSILIKAEIINVSIDSGAKVTYLVRPIDGTDARGYKVDCFFVNESHIIEEGDAHGNL